MKKVELLTKLLKNKYFMLKTRINRAFSTLFVHGLYLTITPAAARTIGELMSDLGSNPEDFDLIVTGDLGLTGSELLYQLMIKEYGLDIKARHKDCGLMIFDLEEQDVCSGGSGCGCGASVLCSYILNGIRSGRWNRVLFVATGALMSPTSCKQGHPIPGIAHGVIIEK